MVAVVDDDAERWVKIGPTTAAGARRSLMHNDLATGIDKTDRRAEARNSGADDVDRAGPHGMPYRRRAPTRRKRLAFARRRGVAKPSATIRSRIEP